MATYPTDAVFDSQNNFTSLGSVTYNSTGSQLSFNLPATASFIGSVYAIADGITQDTTAYYLSDNNSTVTFYNPPSASNLTLKVLSIPARFVKNRTVDASYSITYSNSSVVTINSNDYVIDGETNTFALPENSNTTNKTQLFVYINGVYQNEDIYTFPSATLDDQGIDLPTAIDGANTTLSIRAVSFSVTIPDRCNDMSDRKPDRGFSESRKFDVSVFESQSGYEKRRLISRRPKREYELEYSLLSGLEKQALVDFYNARNGEFEEFTFDLTHINQTGTAIVRFDGPLEIEHVASRSAQAYDNFYSIGFKLKEVYG